MTRLEKIQVAIEKGITCDIETGKVYGIFGREVGNISKEGYVRIGVYHNDKVYTFMAHQFIFYVSTGKIVDVIDHINQDKLDNRTVNLRESNTQKNGFNREVKGYTYHKRDKKYQASIKLNNKNIHLGYFDTELEARQAYLDAKKIYHII